MSNIGNTDLILPGRVWTGDSLIRSCQSSRPARDLGEAAAIVNVRGGRTVRPKAFDASYEAHRGIFPANPPGDWYRHHDQGIAALARIFSNAHSPDREVNAEVGRPGPCINLMIVSATGNQLILVPTRVNGLRENIGRVFYDPDNVEQELIVTRSRLVTLPPLVGDRPHGIPGLPRLAFDVGRWLATWCASVDISSTEGSASRADLILCTVADEHQQLLRNGKPSARSNTRRVNVLPVISVSGLMMLVRDAPHFPELIRRRRLDTVANTSRSLDSGGSWRDGVPVIVAQDRDDRNEHEFTIAAGTPRSARRPRPRRYTRLPGEPGNVVTGHTHAARGPSQPDPATARPATSRGTGNPDPDPRENPPGPQPQVGSASRPNLLLSPSWEERIRNLDPSPRRACELLRILPRSNAHHVGTITVVDDRATAEVMMDFARQRRISYAAVDCEYQYRRPGVFIKRSAAESIAGSTRRQSCRS